MDHPRNQQMLIEEVLYLHALWHQGPPRPIAAAVPRHHLPPTQSTQFKKEKLKTKRNRKSRKKPYNPTPAPNSSSPAAEWPCPPSPPPAATGWPSFPKPPDPNPPPPLSAKDKQKLSAKNSQQNALKSSRKFFLDKANDSDTIDSSASEDDDDSMDEDGGRDRYSFFSKLFMEDALLKEHYVKNFAQGEFSCLVCGAMGGKKMVKKYKNCIALVQHSLTISKTKMRQAHRAFGQAVCKVLGWDIDQLPAIVSLLSENKSGQSQVNVDLGNVDCVEGNNGGVGAANGAFVSVRSEHTSGVEEGNANFYNEKNSITVINVDAVEGNNGVVPESGIVVSLLNESASGAQQNVNYDEESLITSVCLVDSVEDNAGGVVPENGPVVSLLNECTSGEAQNVNLDKESLITSLCTVDSVEDSAVGVVPENGSVGTVISSSGDKGDMSSLTSPDAVKKMEDLCMGHAYRTVEPASEGLIIAAPDVNSGVGNEIQDLQTNNVDFSGLKEDDEPEN